MLRPLVRVALATALVLPIMACAKKKEAPPSIVIPEGRSPEERAAEAAAEAAYSKGVEDGTRALATDPDAAVGHLKRAIEHKSDGPEAHYQLGRALVAKKDDAGALAELSEAIRLNAQYDDALMERAALHDRAGRWGDADADCERVINREADRKLTARAYWLRGTIAEREGKRKDHRYAWGRALDLDPDYQSRLVAGDVTVINHTEGTVSIGFEAFTNADGSARTFPPRFRFTIPGDATVVLTHEKKPLIARSVRYNLSTGNIAGKVSKPISVNYTKGMTLEIHINENNLP
jgi:tetratricopeptide (TPR) repeat protein